MAKPTRKLTSIDLKAVSFTDKFWQPRIKTNREITLPHEYKQCQETGRIDAFKLDWKEGKPNKPHYFWDSDVAKWIEAACYSLETNYDSKLDHLLDQVIALIASAQQKDGYLNVYFTIIEPQNRWANLRDFHELYCAGHLMEAAVAHFHATGKRIFLDTMCRYADYIATVFGTKKGQIPGYCGHEEVELALVKLYHATGDKKYLDLSKYFVDQRGQKPHYFQLEHEKFTTPDDSIASRLPRFDYFQAHEPLRDQKDAIGHAVRGGYIYSGMADIAAETGDETLLKACKTLWKSITERRMYITGGIGSRRYGEKFGNDYELPNEVAYAETCAAIALVFFAQRMLNIEADGHYADVMEQTLYNGVLSGVSLDGTKFFYANPLCMYPENYDDLGGHLVPSRVEWFGCACCPPNIARLLASMGYYAYSQTDDSLYVNLYIAGTVEKTFNGQTFQLRQETDYPWDAAVQFTFAAAQPVKGNLLLRIPNWCKKYQIKVNNKPVKAIVTKGYAKIAGTFADGDTILLTLDMPIQKMQAHPMTRNDTNCVALKRGPLVYCLEGQDNPVDIRAIRLPQRGKLAAKMDKKALGGMVVIEGEAFTELPASWKNTLYREMQPAKMKKIKFKAVPYCLWNNRKPGTMQVWIPQA